jgi:hypothetical protein
MKTFNLEAAIAGAPLITRDGREATEFKRTDKSLIYSCQARTGGHTYSFTETGHYISRKCSEDKDLFMAEPHELPGYSASEPPAEPSKDAVNHPGHYTNGKVECIDAIEAATIGLSGIEAVCTGNAIKYLWRWKQNNGDEDLRKARWYINKILGEQS